MATMYPQSYIDPKIQGPMSTPQGRAYPSAYIPSANIPTPQQVGINPYYNSAASTNAALDTLVSDANAIPEVPQVRSSAIQYNANDYKVPDFNTILKKIYESPEMVSYYTKLLNENNGDVALAKNRLGEDRALQLGRTNQDVGIGTGREQQDLSSALEVLGIQSGQETEGALDTLNKRGMALTDAPGGGLNVATEGRAGFEMDQLRLQQRLRQEAQQRTSDRAIMDIGIKGTRSSQETEQGFARGTQDADIGQRNYRQGLAEDRQNKSVQMASIEQAQALQQQSLNLQKKQLDASAGGFGMSGSNGSSSGPASWDAQWAALHGNEGKRPEGYHGE